MPEQFRRVKKGKKRSTYRLASQVRDAKEEADTDTTIERFYGGLISLVVGLCEQMPIGRDVTVDLVKARLIDDPTFRPTDAQVARVVHSVLLYVSINKEQSETLRARLIRQEGDDLPDSLADPGDLG